MILIDFYLRFAKVLFERYKGRVKYWLTFNEINMLTEPFGAVFCAGMLDEADNNEETRYQAMHHQLVASALAVRMAHEIDPENKLGCMLAYHNGYPYTCHPKDVFFAQQYGQIPIMIVENGLGAVDEITEDDRIHDDYRIDYMRQHIEEMKEAVCDGVDLIGYTCWGCTDVVSASTGEVKKRYGLIFVDKYDDGTGDMSRKRKDSFYWYKKVIESNGEIL